MAIRCMRMEIIFTNFNDNCRKSEPRNSLPNALGMAFSRIKFTIFFVLFPGSFRTVVLSEDLFVFLLRISCHSNVCENSIFALHILEKQLHVFAWSTLRKSRQTLSYMWKFTWEKDIGERKGHNPLESVLFINITKDL